MSNFPIQFTDKVNSPELLAIMQQFGEQTYVDAELINKMRDALNELHARTADTRIIEKTGLQIVGTDVVINELWKWLILSVLYSNDSQITLPITLSSEGNQKLCYLCANQDNGFELVYGPESETNPVAPTINDNLLYITFFLVTDGTVGTPAEPIIGDIYKKKTESLGYGDPYLTGENAVIQLRPEGISRYAFSNPTLVSIDGFGLSLINGNPSAEIPYDGKDLFVENTGTTPITLIHDGTGLASSKFFFLDFTDLVIPAGGKVWLKYGTFYSEVFFKSWNDNTNNSFTVIASNCVDSFPVIGTTSIVEVDSRLIPPDTFIPGDRLWFRARIIKDGTVGYTNHRHSIAGLWFPFAQSATGNRYNQIDRMAIVKSPTITEEISGTTNVFTSSGQFNNPVQLNIDWTIEQEIKIRVNNNSASDSSVVSFWELIRIRG